MSEEDLESEEIPSFENEKKEEVRNVVVQQNSVGGNKSFPGFVIFLSILSILLSLALAVISVFAIILAFINSEQVIRAVAVFIFLLVSSILGFSSSIMSLRANNLGKTLLAVFYLFSAGLLFYISVNIFGAVSEVAEKAVSGTLWILLGILFIGFSIYLFRVKLK